MKSSLVFNQNNEQAVFIYRNGYFEILNSVFLPDV